MKKKKRNPTDITLRNNRARKKEIAELKRLVQALHKRVIRLQGIVMTAHPELSEELVIDSLKDDV